MQQAVERLYQALSNQEKIIIVGDFDVDGATSVALLMRGLTQIGFAHVHFVVPDRFRLGYGLSKVLVEEIAWQKPQLIVTVDNGIASFEGAAYAKVLGIEVIITDHHLPAEQLPEAVAIVNPNQADCAFPSKALAGVGVAFFLLIALRAFLREQGYFAGRTEPNLSVFLDLVALGTVADIVPLDYVNRLLVMQGITRIRQGKAQPGILALLQVVGKNHRSLSTMDLGFAVGPRINAAGRLDDMTQGIMLLLTQSTELAQELAQMLDDFNRERRSIEQKMQAQALQFTQNLQLEDNLPRGVCLFNASWHQGVVGLVASRIKERIHRPVFAFALDEDGELKGSGRSIAGVHLRDVLVSVATKSPGLLGRFGGHAMAAGLSLPKAHLQAFEQTLNHVLQQVEESVFESTLQTDGELQEEDFNLYTAQALRDIPWGAQLPEPLFEGEFYLHRVNVFAERHMRLQMSVHGDILRSYSAILFNCQPEHMFLLQASHARFLYRLAVNDYRAELNLQLIIEQVI